MRCISWTAALIVLVGCGGSSGGLAVTGAWDDDGRVLVVPDAEGLKLLDADGSALFDETWTDLVGDCGQCGGEGASADDDGLLLSFTTEGSTQGGAVARIGADGEADFRLDDFGFPHGIERDPDGSLLVAEAESAQLRWIAGDGSSGTALSTLGSADADWPGAQPNGTERLDVGDRSYLLVSHRGGGGGQGGGSAAGLLSFWDLTDGEPALVWTFPPSGALDVPHGPILRELDGRWWLVWAHTEGASTGGSVGLAVTDDVTVAPSYVADLVPTNTTFQFLRGVELNGDTLILTDSGAGNGSSNGDPSGAIYTAPFPSDLAATGATGAVDADQVFVDLTPERVVDGLDNPFEGWLWASAL